MSIDKLHEVLIGIFLIGYEPVPPVSWNALQGIITCRGRVPRPAFQIFGMSDKTGRETRPLHYLAYTKYYWTYIYHRACNKVRI